MTLDEKKKQILSKKAYTLNDLVTVVELLRAPGGCPWDREQTHKSIRNDLIEETYEVIEAIDNGDATLLREELGDVLLQLVMHAQMESEAGRFVFADVVNDIAAKMIFRHPHVFGDVVAEDTARVLQNWEALKSEEKKRVTVTDKLHAIPPQLPALMRAQKVGKKAAVMDFANAGEVIAKLREELCEIEEAIAAGSKEGVAEELGDLLLAASSLARHTGVDAEKSLCDATNKFIRRFESVERAAEAQGAALAEMTPEAREMLWQNAKNQL